MSNVPPFRIYWVGFFMSIFGMGDLAAQMESDTTRRDTVRVYRLGEIVITDGRPSTVTTARIERVPLAKIDATDGITAAEVVRLVPAARVQTNSRGEALLYLRGAAERQVALFFDGALLNVPWDNRVDISLVPLNAVGGMSVVTGVPSVLYGTNVVGGALNFVSQELREPGYLTEVNAQVGTEGLAEGSVTHIGNQGLFNYIGSFSYASRDGYALPDTAELFGDTEAPFSLHQSDPELRTNTDSRIASAFLRGEYNPGDGGRIGLSMNYIDAEKGVAPEGQKKKARFWRYPLWRNLTVTINGDLMFGQEDEWDLKGAAWWTGFRQAIDQFGSDTYTTRSDREEDRDNTIGTRLLLSRDLGFGALTLAVNALRSTHEQQDFKYDSAGVLLPFLDSNDVEGSYPTMEYEQMVYSTGLEFTASATTDLGVTVGVGFDGMSTPQTGDKPSLDPFSALGVNASALYTPMTDLKVRLAAGRKSRFPTLRELYGEALGRFLINPDLKPEESDLLELGVETTGTIGRVSLTGFGSFTTNTIDQREVEVAGTNRRQRINLPGSRALGVELAGDLTTLAPFRLEGHITYIYNRARSQSDPEGDYTEFLAEKPEALATIEARYDFPFGLTPTVEIVHTGTAYSPGDTSWVPLGASTTINLRLAYRLFASLTPNFSAQVYLRADNVADAVVLPQLGLPGPGREIRGGVKATF